MKIEIVNTHHPFVLCDGMECERWVSKQVCCLRCPMHKLIENFADELNEELISLGYYED